MKTRPLHTGVLALGLLVSCGRAASHHEPDAETWTGGAAGDGPGAAGENATGGSAAAPSSGGTATAAGGAHGDGGAEDGGDTTSAGAAPVLTLPPGCEARAPTESADLCSLGVDCDTSPSVRTYCHRLDSGQWECQCANQDSIYRVENAAGLQACALAARLCSDDSLDVGEETTCQQTNGNGDEDSCIYESDCGNPIDLGATTEARAWLMRFRSAKCSRPGADEPFQCRCSDGIKTSDYTVLADSGELACGPLTEVCLNDATPVFDGGDVCAPLYFSSDSEGCQRVAGCGGTMPLADGVRLAQLEQKYANCVASPGGGSECSCSDDESAFLFRLATPPDDASCEASVLNCSPHAVIKSTAPASCDAESLTTSGPDACRTSLSCVQKATVDDRSIVAEGRLVVACGRAKAGSPWTCSCASSQDTARFQLGAGNATAAQACEQAPAGCLEHMGLHIGPSGDDTVEPPDPLL